MPILTRNNLLNTLNAKPYSNWSNEDDALLGDGELVDQQRRVLNIGLELPAEEWQPIPSVATFIEDTRLPDWFLDGSVTSLEIAGSARDSLGYPRVIRAGQMGVGATSRRAEISNQKKFWRFVALNASGFDDTELVPLRNDLAQSVIAHQLIDWQLQNDQEPEIAYDLMTVRSLVRNRIRDEMLSREQQLVKEINEAIYVDGRYADHASDTDSFLVIGIVKTQRARYLSNRPLQVLYNLREGERTPAFLIERQRGRSLAGNQVVTFYVRLTSPDVVGPSGGIARIELSDRYFMNPAQDSALLDAITGDLVRLRTKDVTYGRGAVTIEPIRLIERELHLVFRDTQIASIETMKLLT